MIDLPWLADDPFWARCLMVSGAMTTVLAAIGALCLLWKMHREVKLSCWERVERTGELSYVPSGIDAAVLLAIMTGAAALVAIPIYAVITGGYWWNEPWYSPTMAAMGRWFQSPRNAWGTVIAALAMIVYYCIPYRQEKWRRLRNIPSPSTNSSPQHTPADTSEPPPEVDMVELGRQIVESRCTDGTMPECWGMVVQVMEERGNDEQKALAATIRRVTREKGYQDPQWPMRYAIQQYEIFRKLNTVPGDNGNQNEPANTVPAPGGA